MKFHKFIEYVKKGDLENVKLFINNGVDVRKYDDCALKFSAIRGHFEIVKLLIDCGTNINAEDDLALQLSAYNGHFEIVNLLLEKGADTHAKDNYALRWSTRNGHLEVVKLLIKHGADIHAMNDQALLWSFDHLEITSYLLSFYNDQEITMIIKLNKPKLLSFIMKNANSTYEKLIQGFRNIGVDVYDLIEREITYY